MAEYLSFAEEVLSKARSCAILQGWLSLSPSPDDEESSCPVAKRFLMRLNGLIRRVRRLKITSVWSALYHLLEPANAPPKHLKIDDEEKQLSGHTTIIARSPLIRMLRLLLLTLLIVLVMAFLLAYTVYKPPPFVIRYMQYKYPDVLFHLPLPKSDRMVALTIDDSPSSSTAQILDLLKTYNAKATFFIIGNQVAEYPSLIQRIHDEGHELGNHAWADEASWKLPLSELERQVKEVEALIPANASGQKWFRPGWGWFNKAMVEKMKEMGYKTVLCSIFPHDPQIPHPRVNAAHVLSMVKPGRIVLMHDRRSYSAEQLEIVLRGLSKRQWEVVSLGALNKVYDEIEGNIEERYID